ncbi:hypothetical protein BROUX41_004080 [Berkeleyomyces rouxiae]|uniref:uncharacterized protein n=1 Tax=Berkeleyomyces rouxiae TaxID=2035830 RepID=UPI003B7DAB20
MRHRITFVQPPETALDPDALKLTTNALSAPDLAAAVREDRFTVALSELPDDVAQTLEGHAELHLRWASARPFETLEPFSSRITPGFHVTSALAKGADALLKLPELCGFVSTAFGPLDCSDPEAFTKRLAQDAPAESSDVYQFYQAVDSLDFFSKFLKTTFCSLGESITICNEAAKHMKDLVSLDLTYDKTAQNIRLVMTWPLQKQPINISGPPSDSDVPYRTEVGILTKGVAPNMSPDQVGMTGVLSVFGESKRPSSVLFSFPSRHRKSDAHFAADFLQPTGLHPTWQLQLDSSMPPAQDCTAHAYLTLPRTIFADRYQLADPLFAQSKNLSALRYTSTPVDLEKPEYTTPTWGSNVLLDLAPPASADAPWTAEIPLHLRYLAPAAGGYTDMSVPYPAVFWACGPLASPEAEKLTNNPFDRTVLGYDALFAPGTVFWHLTPKPAAQAVATNTAAPVPTGGLQLTSHVTVPVLDTRASGWIELGTAAAVGAGFLWVVWCLYAGAKMGKKTAAKMAGKKKADTKKSQ